MEEKKPTEMVTLKVKEIKGRKSKSVTLPIGQANMILKMRKSQWELNDKTFIWNGTEVAKNSKLKA